MENIQFIIKDYHISKLGIGNIMKCLISALSVNPDTVIECYPQYEYGAYDSILQDRFIFKGKGHKELEKVYTCRLLILSNEEPYQQDIPMEEWYVDGLENPRFHHFFTFKKRIDWNYDASLVDERVKYRMFKTIDSIQFTDMVYHEVQRLADMFVDQPALGISVRTWKSSHESNIDRPYQFATYRDKILQIIQEHREVSTIILSIDNQTFLEPYLHLFEETEKRVIILDRLKHWNPIQYAMIKVLVLSKCLYVIGNRISTFTELVFWFGKCRPQIYTVG
jgi:hypothetical protein